MEARPHSDESPDGVVAEQLMSLVYEELHAIAESLMRHERKNHTLQPTAIVNEAYLRLADQHRAEWKSREHFLAIAAGMVRRVLVDHARKHNAQKRGGARTPLALDAVGEVPTDENGVDLMALDEAMEELGKLSDRQVRVVDLRFFGGLEVPQVADVLGVSQTTVKEDWRLAKAWLRRRLRN